MRPRRKNPATFLPQTPQHSNAADNDDDEFSLEEANFKNIYSTEEVDSIPIN